MNDATSPPSPPHPWVARVTRWSVGIGSLVAALLIAAVLTRTAPSPQPGEGAVIATKVPVIELQTVMIGRQWRGLGTVRAIDQAAVPAEVAAVVQRIAEGIDEGMRVEAGQVLVELNTDDFEQQAAIARANIAALEAQINQLDAQEARLKERSEIEKQLMAIAEEERERVQRIYESGAAGRQGYDRARQAALESERAVNATLEQLDAIGPRRTQLQAQVLSQKASLEIADLNLRRSIIRSPINGIIQALDVKLGERIAPGQRVAQVVGLDRVEVPLNVPSSARSDLSRGDPVLIRSASREDRRWEATVSRILPQDDPVSRTATFFATVEQPDAAARFGTADGASLLLPGAFVSGVVSSDASQPRWVVPRRAVRNDRVLLVQDGMIRSCEVEADFSFEGRFPQFGVTDDQWVALKPGTAPFEPGDQLVVNVTVTLRDGMRIEPLLLHEAAMPESVSRVPAGPRNPEAQP